MAAIPIEMYESEKPCQQSPDQFQLLLYIQQLLVFASIRSQLDSFRNFVPNRKEVGKITENEKTRLHFKRDTIFRLSLVPQLPSVYRNESFPLFILKFPIFF